MTKILTTLLDSPDYYGVKIYLINGDKLLITDLVDEADSIIHLVRDDMNYFVPISSILHVEAVKKIS